MADTKISALAAGGNLAATDKIPAVETAGVGPVAKTGQQLAAGLLGSTSFNGKTETASKPLIDLSQTWNNAATTFTAAKLNVTDTASASGSKLLDLQSGGVSKFVIRADGGIAIGQGSFSNGSAIVPYNAGDWGLSFLAGGSGGTSKLVIIGGAAPTLRMSRDGELGWSSFVNPEDSASDTKLSRDAAGVIAQRNSTNAQTFRVYRTYTDASNYARLSLGWNSTTANIAVEAAGTGAAGSVAFGSAALATNATTGFLMIPSCAGAPTGTPADIPTGQIPMVWDSTNLKLYVYTGGAWKASAAFT